MKYTRTQKLPTLTFYLLSDRLACVVKCDFKSLIRRENRIHKIHTTKFLISHKKKQ